MTRLHHHRARRRRRGTLILASACWFLVSVLWGSLATTWLTWRPIDARERRPEIVEPAGMIVVPRERRLL